MGRKGGPTPETRLVGEWVRRKAPQEARNKMEILSSTPGEPYGSVGRIGGPTLTLLSTEADRTKIGTGTSTPGEPSGNVGQIGSPYLFPRVRPRR